MASRLAQSHVNLTPDPKLAHLRHRLPVFSIFTVIALRILSRHPLRSPVMNRQGAEAFAKLAQQLNRARMQASGAGGGAGGGFPGGSKNAVTGGGAIIALALGGLALNYSLYNGEYSDLTAEHAMPHRFGRY